MKHQVIDSQETPKVASDAVATPDKPPSGPPVAGATPHDAGHVYDVVVVGAGVSGLATARRLVSHGVTNLVVLEAQRRVGGRTLDVRGPDGTLVELGGQWVGPGQDEILRLAKQLGLHLHDTYSRGKSIYRHDGRNRRFEGDIYPCSWLALADLYLAQRKIDRLARRIDAEAPWRYQRARQLDALSVGAWIEENLRTREGKQLLRLGLRTVYGDDVDMVSLLDMLAAVSAAGAKLERLLDDAQSSRFVEGPQALSQAMAEQLGPDVLRLGENVEAIVDWQPNAGDAAAVHADVAGVEGTSFS